MEQQLELQEVPVNVIETTLQKHNVTAKVLADLKEKYLPMTIGGVEDKAGYKAVDEARKACKKLRVLTTNVCEAERAEYLRKQKEWVAAEKSITGQILEVETHLEKEIAKIDAEKERLRVEAENKERERIQDRINALGAYGHTADYMLIKQCNDETFAGMLAEAKADFEQHEAIKAEAERQRIAEEQRLKEEREDLEKQRAEQERKEAEFKVEQDRIAKEQADREEKIRAEQEQRELSIKAEQDKLAQERKAQEELRANQRGNQLHALGMRFNGEEYVLEDVNVHWTEIKTMEPAEWNTLIAKITPAITKRVEDARAKAQEENNRQIEEEKRLAVEAALRQKEALEKEEKEKQDAIIAEQQRQEALRPDKQKLLDLGTAIVTIALPELSSDASKAILAEVKTLLNKVKTHIDNKVKTL